MHQNILGLCLSEPKNKSTGLTFGSCILLLKLESLASFSSLSSLSSLSPLSSSSSSLMKLRPLHSLSQLKTFLLRNGGGEKVSFVEKLNQLSLSAFPWRPDLCPKRPLSTAASPTQAPKIQSFITSHLFIEQGSLNAKQPFVLVCALH